MSKSDVIFIKLTINTRITHIVWNISRACYPVTLILLTTK